MASRKPVIHGRDHLPGGSDPIPKLVTSDSDLLFQPNAAYAHYLTGSETCASGSGVFMSFATLVAGDGTMLDVTNPAQPEVTVQGVYAAMVTFSSTTVLWTSGATFQGILTANGADQQQMWSTVTIGTDQAPRQGFVSVTAQMRVGDSFQLELSNYDSGSRDMTADMIWVQRILAY